MTQFMREQLEEKKKSMLEPQLDWWAVSYHRSRLTIRYDARSSFSTAYGIHGSSMRWKRIARSYTISDADCFFRVLRRICFVREFVLQCKYYMKVRATTPRIRNHFYGSWNGEKTRAQWLYSRTNALIWLRIRVLDQVSPRTYITLHCSPFLFVFSLAVWKWWEPSFCKVRCIIPSCCIGIALFFSLRSIHLCFSLSPYVSL